MKKVIPFHKEIHLEHYLAEITSISLEHTLKVENESVLGEFIISGDYKMSDTSTTTEKFSFSLPFDITLDEKYLLNKVTVDVDDFFYEIINNNTLVVNIDVLLDHLEEKPLPIDREESNSIIEEKNSIIEENKIPKEEIKEEIEEIQEVKKETEDLESVCKKEDIVIKESILKEDRKEVTMEERCIEDEELPEKNTQNPVIIKEKVVPVAEASPTNLFEQFDMNDETYVTYKICIVREGDSVMTILEKYGISEEELSKYNDLKDIKIGDKIIIPTNYVRN